VSVVCLMSGGLDSAVTVALLQEAGLHPCPLFVDYGQLNKSRELEACQNIAKSFELAEVEIVDLAGYGRTFPSGITERSKDIFLDAFLPCRNLLLITAGSAYAHRINASAVAMGLLSASTALFPDQSDEFIKSAQLAVSAALGRSIELLLPLRAFVKKDVIALAGRLKIAGWYSCHAGIYPSCGQCVACREYLEVEA